MALQIGNQGPTPEEIAGKLEAAIVGSIPGSEIEVTPRGTGHFEIAVTSAAFAGQSRVKQHQLVYGAITSLMSGQNAPVHAIDKLDCRVP